jgi:hypothetical protein
MQRRFSVPAVILLAIVIAGANETANASLAPKWSDQQLIDFSEVVVAGEVTAIASAREGNAIYTYVTIEVDEVLRGHISDRHVVLKQAGGVVDDIGMDVSGQARFERGEHVLVFAEVRPRDRTLYTTALWQGKWSVQIDPVSGRRVAYRNDPSTPDSEVDVRDLSVLAQSVAATAHDRAEAFVTSPVETPVDIGVDPFVTLATPARWTSQPVLVDIQAGGQPGLPGGGAAQMANVLAQWNAAGSAHTWSVRSTSAAARCQDPFNNTTIVAVVWNDPCADISNTGGTIAVAATWFTVAPSGGTVNGVTFRTILEVTVTTNDSATAQQFVLNGNCFQQVLLHEMGHALGLGHTADATAVMFATVSFAQCSAAPLPLQPDDIAGVRFIYPSSTPPPAGVPAPVTGLTATVTGTTVAIRWNASTGATSYRLVAVLGGVTVFDANVGAGTAVTATAPSGTFTVTVFAVNAAGQSAGTSTTFTVGGGTLPSAPTSVTAVVGAGRTLTLSWPAGAGATSYRLQATLNGVLVFDQNIGPATAVGPLPVPAGSYTVTVFSVNAAGQSPTGTSTSFVVP